jgi:hypothetical protein
LIYIAVVAFTLIPTDVYSYYFNAKMQDLSENQIIEGYTNSFSFCNMLGNAFITIINLGCTGSFFFELYSDLLIIWVSLFSSTQVAFGFFAVIFPLLNRIMQLFVCLRLFLIGIKMTRKTINNEKLD